MRDPTRRLQPQLHRRPDHPQHGDRTRVRDRRHLLLRVRHRPPDRRRLRLLPRRIRLQRPRPTRVLGHPHRRPRSAPPTAPAHHSDQRRSVKAACPTTGIGAVALNVTVTDTENPTIGGGYVTVYPCGTRPDASNLNFTTGQTIPNAVIAPVSATGDICFYVYGTAHLLADVSGYFPN